MEDQICYKATADCNMAVGVLMGEAFGLVHCLVLSWADQETLEAQWQLLGLCTHWRASALYGQTTTIRLYGSGEPIPVSQPEPGLFGMMQSALVPTYVGQWTLPDALAVRDFIQGTRQRGYFVLLAAVGQVVCEDFPPLFAFIRGGDHER